VATVRTRTQELLPGLAAAIAIAIVARLLTTYLLPAILAEVTVALVLGAVGAAVLPAAPRAALAPGVRIAGQRILRVGIVLLGARLSLAEIAGIGGPALGTIVITMTVSLTLVLILARLAGVEPRLAVLLAVGSAVCGNTAIVATAPVIGARPREVAYAVATITLFGSLAVLLYPVIGHALGVDQATFGLWSGVAVHDTSQVIATSSAYGSGALDVATVVKLIRNALMAPLLLGIAWAWATFGPADPDASASTGGAVDRGIRRAFPIFVLGFVALAALRSVNVIGPDLAATLDTIARACILVALAGVGLSIRFDELRQTRWHAIAIGLVVAVVVGLGSLAAITTFGLGAGIGS
jgi:uncharacterized integral membrane protein (TIGR00698 family)